MYIVQFKMFGKNKYEKIKKNKNRKIYKNFKF